MTGIALQQARRRIARGRLAGAARDAVEAGEIAAAAGLRAVAALNA